MGVPPQALQTAPIRPPTRPPESFPTTGFSIAAGPLAAHPEDPIRLSWWKECNTMNRRSWNYFLTSGIVVLALAAAASRADAPTAGARATAPRRAVIWAGARTATDAATVVAAVVGARGGASAATRPGIARIGAAALAATVIVVRREHHWPRLRRLPRRRAHRLRLPLPLPHQVLLLRLPFRLPPPPTRKRGRIYW